MYWQFFAILKAEVGSEKSLEEQMILSVVLLVLLVLFDTVYVSIFLDLRSTTIVTPSIAALQNKAWHHNNT